jgi:competence protein ComEC
MIDAHLPYPESAEMRALIIGDRGGINEDLRQRFALTGMAHLLVISGLHLGIVAAAAFFMVRWLIGIAAPSLMVHGYANKLAAAGGALAICAYAAIAGHHVSTLRALVMVLSYALAVALDRSRELVSSLALAALVVLLWLPSSTADIGFQLSFASVLVILLGMRRFTAWWRWRYMNPLAPPRERSKLNIAAELVAGYIAVSFWAMIGTAPLTAFYFNQFSLVGLVANAVVVPIMGFGAVICGLVAAALSFVAPPIAVGLIVIAGKLAALGTALAGWFKAWPLAWERIFTPTLLELVIVYGLILRWLAAPVAGEAVRARLLGGDTRQAAVASLSSRSRWRAAAGVLLGLAMLIDAGYWTRQRYFAPDLRVTFLSVGEGDAAVVRFPGSRVMLIDGGGAFQSAFDPGERVVAPFLWSQKIMHVDYVAVSHPDRDHFGGLIFIARNFAPSQFWTGGVETSDETYAELVEAMRRIGAVGRICNSAMPSITIGGVALRCAGPLANIAELKENNSSSVIRLSYGATSLLFPGDLEAKGERELIASGADLRATVLKVPHHGSHTSSTPAFIAAVDPAVAVISLGYHNRFHFPADEVLARYRDAGVTILRTDEDGAISLESNSNKSSMWSYRHGARSVPAIRH